MTELVAVLTPVQPPAIRQQQFADVTDQEVALRREALLRRVVAHNNRNIERNEDGKVVSLAAWKAWTDPAPTEADFQFLMEVEGGVKRV